CCSVFSQEISSLAIFDFFNKKLLTPDLARYAPPHSPVRSHSLSVLSALPDSAVRPSGENATEVTGPLARFQCASDARPKHVFVGGGHMIKSELVERISAQSRFLGQRYVAKIVDAILGEITAAMARGDRVELRGFGAFSVKSRAARAGRNPRT